MAQRTRTYPVDHSGATGARWGTGENRADRWHQILKNISMNCLLKLLLDFPSSYQLPELD